MAWDEVITYTDASGSIRRFRTKRADRLFVGHVRDWGWTDVYRAPSGRLVAVYGNLVGESSTHAEEIPEDQAVAIMAHEDGTVTPEGMALLNKVTE